MTEPILLVCPECGEPEQPPYRACNYCGLSWEDAERYEPGPNELAP